MNGKKVLGMIFANIHEGTLDSLTAMRTMGSVPFCSRYRLIDFPLSNMVESGITKVGVITNANFQSLMDHVGTGKPWDLSRKNDGLFILPPFNVGSATMWGNRIDAIYGNMGFLEQSNQAYVVMCDCNNVLSLASFFAISVFRFNISIVASASMRDTVCGFPAGMTPSVWCPTWPAPRRGGSA